VTADRVPAIGAPRNRVDGRLKVTGAARYAADWAAPGLAYGYIVQSTIAAGRIASIDTAAAARQAGVIAILTHENAPRVDARARSENDRELSVLQDAAVRYDREPIAVVVADTFARAKYAASLVDVRYDREAARTRFEQGIVVKPKDIHGKPPDTLRGDADSALAQAAVRVDRVYTTPIEHHNPMEPHAAIALWDGDRLKLYDGSQGTTPARARIAAVFGLPPDNVEVITKFAGGAFGSKGSVWSHTILAAMAAKVAQRPVQIALWRPQMWGPVGNRPATRQRVALAAGSDGRLAAQIHETTSETSMFDEFVEPCGTLTTVLYASPALRVTHRINRMNYGTPTYMRAPGESSGSFALESAMDELAYATGLDPIELRLRNYAEVDPTEQKPFSSKSLRDCYARGAEAFGWASRTPQPRSMRDGRYLIGMGMASSSYPTNRSKASCSASVAADGSVTVRSAGVDVGTGAYTAFTQIFAENMGVAPEAVTVQLGDSSFPEAPVAGGSQLTASLGSAMKDAALTPARNWRRSPSPMPVRRCSAARRPNSIPRTAESSSPRPRTAVNPSPRSSRVTAARPSRCAATRLPPRISPTRRTRSARNSRWCASIPTSARCASSNRSGPSHRAESSTPRRPAISTWAGWSSVSAWRYWKRADPTCAAVAS
jgi:xanthine dehydrogenase YagR molybdenum-binding subunit